MADPQIVPLHPDRGLRLCLDIAPFQRACALLREAFPRISPDHIGEIADRLGGFEESAFIGPVPTQSGTDVWFTLYPSESFQSLVLYATESREESMT